MIAFRTLFFSSIDPATIVGRYVDLRTGVEVTSVTDHRELAGFRMLPNVPRLVHRQQAVLGANAVKSTYYRDAQVQHTLDNMHEIELVQRENAELDAQRLQSTF